MKHVSRLSVRPLAGCASICVALLVAAPSVFAAPPAAPTAPAAVDPYTRAVAAYVNAAAAEVKALGDQVQNVQKANAKKDLTAVKQTLDVCSKLVEDLRNATQGEFDTVKSKYEKNRNEVIRLLTEAKAS